MPNIILGSGQLAGGYEVANSLRFDDGSGDNLSTSSLGTPTSAKTYTLSWWVKRANIGEATYQFGWYDGSRTNSGDIVFDAGDTLSFYHGSNDGNGKLLKPNRLFRYDGNRWVKIEDSVRITKTNNDERANYKTKFVNQSGTTTINGLTVEQRQALTDALKPKADN